MNTVKSKFLVVIILIALLFTTQVVMASDGDVADNMTMIETDDSINEISNCDGIGDDSNAVGDANQVDKLSASEGNDIEEKLANPIDIYHSSSVEYIIGDNETISNETYKMIGVWDDYYGSFEGTNFPFLMNDTTWTWCIDAGAPSPDGSGYGYPGIYKRITLTDDDKIINKYTGEDILPYLRTLIYLYYNSSDDFYTLSHGKVSIPMYFIYAFTEGNYRDPNSYYNHQYWSKTGKYMYDYVKKVCDLVDSGYVINCSGSFEGSDFLKYQFYLYVSDPESNYYGYQSLLGFNILTEINVTKTWDDNDDSDKLRPDSIDVQLYGNGDEVGNIVQLDETNNWTYTFIDLPVYYAYNTTVKLNKNDYTVKTEYEDVFNMTIRKVWDESYTGTKPTYIYYKLYADGEYLGQLSLRKSYNWEATIPYFTKYDENGKEIVYTVEDVTSYKNSTPTGYLETIKSDDFQVKTFIYNITNDEFRKSSAHMELFDGKKYYDVFKVDSSNNWTFSVNNLPLDAEPDFIVYYAYDNPHINVVNYTVKELNVPDVYVSSIERTSELVNPLMPTQDQIKDDLYRYIDVDVNKLLKNVTISNKLETTKVNVTKIWDDENDKDKIRPFRIVVNLIVGGKVIKSVEISGPDWKYTFENLPKYHDNGSLIVYEISEDTVDGYTVQITGSNGTFEITNTHVPEEDSNKTKPVPPSPEPPSPEFPSPEHPSSNPPKEGSDKTVKAKMPRTGNPLLLLLFALMISFGQYKRKN